MKTKIQQLIKLVEESNIDELEVSTFWGGQKIRVRKNNTISNAQPVIMQNPITQQQVHPPEIVEPYTESRQPDLKAISSEQNPDTESVEEINLGEEFKSPLVGTFYQAAKPGTPPFVKEGDTIIKGQIICIIEAMKIFNEIEAEHSGIVKKILVKDGTPVEYGQSLMIINPS